MKCQYCTAFQKAVDRKLVKQNDKTVYSERFCDIKTKYITGDNSICDMFSVSKNFWCNTDNAWLDVSVCLHRQNKGQCKCKQGKDLIQSARRRSTNGIIVKSQLKRRA